VIVFVVEIVMSGKVSKRVIWDVTTKTFYLKLTENLTAANFRGRCSKPD
jgi:hypothetical protein